MFHAELSKNFRRSTSGHFTAMVGSQMGGQMGGQMGTQMGTQMGMGSQVTPGHMHAPGQGPGYIALGQGLGQEEMYGYTMQMASGQPLPYQTYPTGATQPMPTNNHNRNNNGNGSEERKSPTTGTPLYIPSHPPLSHTPHLSPLYTILPLTPSHLNPPPTLRFSHHSFFLGIPISYYLPPRSAPRQPPWSVLL